MGINSNRLDRWKADIIRSVDFYNNWFMRFAPEAYKNTRVETTKQVEVVMKLTDNFSNISSSLLMQHPEVLSILRMATAPPIARDRLIGLSNSSPNLIKNMEIEKRLPPKMNNEKLKNEIDRVTSVIIRLLDRDIFPWLNSKQNPENSEIYRTSTIIADRLCGSLSDPIIRNAQERRQLDTLKLWLEQREYIYLKPCDILQFDKMKPGTFSFRVNVPVNLGMGANQVNITVDALIMPFNFKAGNFPLLIEAKSAGDFTNTNKRRKEEAIKVTQLRRTYGDEIYFILFLCGYFDSGYLGYEASEGIDWIWEHRIDDLIEMGV